MLRNVNKYNTIDVGAMEQHATTHTSIDCGRHRLPIALPQIPATVRITYFVA